MDELNEEEINPDAVFFRCRICSFEFQADPNFIPIPCPQCGSEDTERI
ncbi:MAG: hypothetical protein KKG76_02315 [Euryarchaeota archaeon]|nr:hypothetical protein [Euryarchaeota archaeon]